MKRLMLSPRSKAFIPPWNGLHTLWTLVPRKSALDIPCASHCLGILVGLSGVLVAGVWSVVLVDCAAQSSHLTYHLVGTHLAAFGATFLSLRPVSALRRSPLTVPGYRLLVLLLSLIKYFQDLRQHCFQQISAGLSIAHFHGRRTCRSESSTTLTAMDLRKYSKFITICTTRSGMSVYGFTALSLSRCRQSGRTWHWSGPNYVPTHAIRRYEKGQFYSL